ncbi:MAG: diguanylate cyclase [Gammaproteobacteria bacterium]|nr:diguanylate cyclase [Gammaproteobacteria bacterium]MDH5651541.1 diguanylate cyclase [Gammaproteobacteria bacterium]
MNDVIAQFKPRILAVDDSKVMRRAIAKILGNEYEVIEAEHGEDAWTLLMNDETIQVVFTDLSMPYLDGYGLLERIRQAEDDRIREMPVIIITGKDDDETAQQQAFHKGATDFISKPFESVQLQARAKAHVQFELTARKLSETSAQLETQSAIDGITNLGGQRYFCKVADETLAYIKRHGGHFILLRMDIDHFESLFIKNGKPVADSILREVGQHLAKRVRHEDKLARVGLAKFAMLFPAANLEETQQLAERIRRDIESLEFKLKNNKSLRITVSIGILEPQLNPDSEISALMEEAEACLSEAVTQGGNRVSTRTTVTDVLGVSGMYAIDVSTAIRLIHEGRAELVKPHTASLLKELRPLLEFLSQATE